MRGDLFTGWATLAGDFPASVNTDDDPTKLKPFESPVCYGHDCRAAGYLRAGSIIAGTTRTTPTKTIGGQTYNWYFDRAWRASSADLIYGAKFYDNVYQIQGRGKVTAEASIVTFMPALSGDMWIVTATGSQILPNANAPAGQFVLGQFFEDAYVATASHATTVTGIPHFANAKGVFSWNGSQLKELTRAVRNNLGSFVGAEIKADYSNKYLVGTSKFVIDLDEGKLFDYGTSGFLFTSRTLVDANYAPLQIDALSFDLTYILEGNDRITWQVKWEDGDWEDQEDITVQGAQETRTHIEVPIDAQRLARKFTMRITSLPTFVAIRSIKAMVRSFAQETPSE